MYKVDVGWIVNLNNFLASWSLRSDMVTWWAGQLWHLYMACRVHIAQG